MKVRIISPGWETYSGSFGYKATFTDGVSDGDLDARQIARIGSSLNLVDADDGAQVGPAAMAIALMPLDIPIAAELQTKTQFDTEVDDARSKLMEAEAVAKAKEADALATAQAKAAETPDEIIIYSRQELEAIAANDGINELRKLALPYGVKARAINELVGEILAAQSAKVVA